MLPTAFDWQFRDLYFYRCFSNIPWHNWSVKPGWMDRGGVVLSRNVTLSTKRTFWTRLTISEKVVRAAEPLLHGCFLMAPHKLEPREERYTFHLLCKVKNPASLFGWLVPQRLRQHGCEVGGKKRLQLEAFRCNLSPRSSVILTLVLSSSPWTWTTWPWSMITS